MCFNHRVWYRTLSLHMHALCMYSTFGHHPHPLGYPCAKFYFCQAPIAELARGEKSDTQSLTHSLSHSPILFDMPGTEVFAAE